MAKRKHKRRKLTGHSEHAPLAALAPVIAEKPLWVNHTQFGKRSNLQ